jgi:hypothetical protein
MITEQLRSFPCPKCNELINTGMDKCSYCSAPIDPAEAEAAAAVQDQVNRAYSDASFNRNMAVGMWVFFLIRFIPFVGIAGWIGMFILMVLVPIRLVMWQVRFRGIKTNDPDHKRAKTNRNVAFLIWIPLPILLGLAFLVLAYFA